MRLLARYGFGLLTTVVVLGSALASVKAGAPADLPDAALESPALLHAERVLAAVVAYLVLVVVLARSFAGELPTELTSGGLKYAVSEVKDATADAVEALSEAVEAARGERQELRRRVEALEERR